MDEHQKKRTMNILKKTFLAILAVLVVLAIGGYIVLKKTFLQEFPELQGKPETGKWYEVAPEGAVSADGSPWRAFFKKGSANKFMVYFFGGGVSVDEYTAARGRSVVSEGGFYSDNVKYQDYVATWGIGSQDERNPFKDWSVLAIPYGCGDFHCGTGDFSYISLEGEQKVLHHHGYTNYSGALSKVLPYIGQPEALLVCGYSAGGWGTSILAEDVIAHFPNTNNVTVCVDGSLGLYKDWRFVAEHVWKAPAEITGRIVSDNIILDCLLSLHRDYKDRVKILYGCSVRDEALANVQTYFDAKRNDKPTKVDGDVQQKNLKKFVKQLQDSIPSCGIFLWDDIVTQPKEALMQHTILLSSDFFTDRSGNGSFAKWIDDAVKGYTHSFGLDLVDKKY